MEKKFNISTTRQKTDICPNSRGALCSPPALPHKSLRNDMTTASQH